MRFAIASEQEYEELDDVYHYLPEGAKLTLCGRKFKHAMDEKPQDMRLCKQCKRRFSNSKALNKR